MATLPTLFPISDVDIGGWHRHISSSGAAFTTDLWSAIDDAPSGDDGQNIRSGTGTTADYTCTLTDVPSDFATLTAASARVFASAGSGDDSHGLHIQLLDASGNPVSDELTVMPLTSGGWLVFDETFSFTGLTGGAPARLRVRRSFSQNMGNDSQRVTVARVQIVNGTYTAAVTSVDGFGVLGAAAGFLSGAGDCPVGGEAAAGAAAATASATGTAPVAATGTPSPPPGQAAGEATVTDPAVSGSAALDAAPAVLSAAATAPTAASGDLGAAARLDGDGATMVDAAGFYVAAAATAIGDGGALIGAAGTCVTGSAVVDGNAAATAAGVGEAEAAASQLAADGTTDIDGAGGTDAGAAQLAGVAGSTDQFAVIAGAAALNAGSADIDSEGEALVAGGASVVPSPASVDGLAALITSAAAALTASATESGAAGTVSLAGIAALTAAAAAITGQASEFVHVLAALIVASRRPPTTSTSPRTAGAHTSRPRGVVASARPPTKG